MSDQKISEFPVATSLLGGDYLPVARGGGNKRITYTNLLTSLRSSLGIESVVATFNGRSGAVVLTSADLNGLSGAGLSGIGTGTGGVINTGTTTIGGDSEATGVGVVVLQTRGATRLQVKNDGTIAIGDSSQTAASRFELATQSSNLVALQATTFNFTNGPTGDLDYKDNTFALAYNSATNGTKTNAGEVNFALNHEPKFRNGARGVGASNFQTEIYYSWTNPAGDETIRPWGFNVQHADSSVVHGLQGDVYFLRNVGNGGTQTAFWHENGLFDLSLTDEGSIRLPNNQFGSLLWANAAGDNSIPAVYVDDDDVIRLAPGGHDIIVGANNITGGNYHASVFGSLEADAADTYISFPGGTYMRFFSDAVKALEISEFGTSFQGRPVIFEPDNEIDLGKISGTYFRPQDVFVGRDVVVGRNVEVAGVLKLTNGSLKTVVFGADDSGGSGYRMLRVAN